jgi:hypothetical protein
MRRMGVKVVGYVYMCKIEAGYVKDVGEVRRYVYY